MALDPVTGVADAVTTLGGVINNVIDKIWPDPIKREQIKAELAKAQAAGDLQQMQLIFQLALGQIEVNKIEAASSSVFVSGWRPFVGWVCGGALVWSYIAQPMLNWMIVALGADFPHLPDLDIAQLVTLLLTLLGMASLRSIDKRNGVS